MLIDEAQEIIYEAIWSHLYETDDGPEVAAKAAAEALSRAGLLNRDDDPFEFNP